MTTPDPNKVLLAHGAIGADAEDWLKSDLGRTVVGLARIEAKLCMDQLKGADPADHQLIRRLQNEIWRADHFEGWLTELIMKGRQALTQYDVRNSDQLDGEETHGQEDQGAIQPHPGHDPAE